jgi:integrase
LYFRRAGAAGGWVASKSLLARSSPTAGLTGVSPHTLRHSFASVAVDLQLSEPTIAMLIGHKGRSVTSRYTHHADAVLLAAADLVASRVAELMGEARASGQVIEMRPASA